MSDDAIRRLHEARAAEKEQALFYRLLAGDAEAADDAVAVERLNGLLADEQHHLSRITARLLELGETVADLSEVPAPVVALAAWETVARAREGDEVARYEELIRAPWDDVTGALLHEILAAERNHERELGGKWMMA